MLFCFSLCETLEDPFGNRRLPMAIVFLSTELFNHPKLGMKFRIEFDFQGNGSAVGDQPYPIDGANIAEWHMTYQCNKDFSMARMTPRVAMAKMYLELFQQLRNNRRLQHSLRSFKLMSQAKMKPTDWFTEWHEFVWVTWFVQGFCQQKRSTNSICLGSSPYFHLLSIPMGLFTLGYKRPLRSKCLRTLELQTIYGKTSISWGNYDPWFSTTDSSKCLKTAQGYFLVLRPGDFRTAEARIFSGFEGD